MNKAIFILILTFLTLTCSLGQDVSNVRSYEEDGKMVILYDLLSQTDTKLFFIKLSSSDDGGKSFAPITSGIDGDANTLVGNGFNHVIIWGYSNEIASQEKDFIFKVEAFLLNKEAALTKATKSGIGVQVIDVARTGPDVYVIIALSNETTEIQSATVSVNNFFVVDSKDKIYRDVSGDILKPFVLANKKKYAIVFIKNIDEQVKLLRQLEFNASGIIAKYANVTIREN